MAEARQETKTVEVTTTREVKGYNLFLTEEEARTLSTVLDNVGGRFDRSRRKFTQRIARALEDAGVRSITVTLYSDLDHTKRGSLYFKDEPGIEDLD